MQEEFCLRISSDLRSQIALTQNLIGVKVRVITEFCKNQIPIAYADPKTRIFYRLIQCQRRNQI